METDHKPLIPLLGKANLDSLPPRILRFRIRLSRFDYSISHVPGKFLYTADALSRAPLKNFTSDTDGSETESFVQGVVVNLPANSDRLEEFRETQQSDPLFVKIIQFCQSQWPGWSRIEDNLVPYWRVRSELSVVDGLLMFGSRIVVPKCLQTDTLMKIHRGHLGVVRCHQRISAAVWWPNVSKEMEKYIQSCPKCLKMTPLAVQPLIQTPLPSYPWEKIGADLFELNKCMYLIVADYFSRFVEVLKLTSTTSVAVVKCLKALFAVHGIPAVLMSDNGPQFDSTDMKSFAERDKSSHM